ncbi:hypothetical protein Tco_0105879, partial [Tanacetum coccineum]
VLLECDVYVFPSVASGIAWLLLLCALIGPQSEFNLSNENKNQRPLEPLNRRYAFEEIRWRWWCWNQMAVVVVPKSDGGGGAADGGGGAESKVCIP